MILRAQHLRVTRAAESQKVTGVQAVEFGSAVQGSGSQVHEIMDGTAADSARGTFLKSLQHSGCFKVHDDETIARAACDGGSRHIAVELW